MITNLVCSRSIKPNKTIYQNPPSVLNNQMKLDAPFTNELHALEKYTLNKFSPRDVFRKPWKREVKYLVVIFDERLRFGKHCQEARRKLIAVGTSLYRFIGRKGVLDVRI